MLFKVIWILIAYTLVNTFLSHAQNLKSTNNQISEGQTGYYQTSRKQVRRLRDGVNPVYYDLEIVPQLENEFNFTGKVMISVLLSSSRYIIELHSRNLSIEYVKVFNPKGEEESRVSYKLDPENEILTIDTYWNLYSNTKYNITIKFNGTLNDKNYGFYKISYDTSNNGTRDKKWLALTQFEPTYARMAFPCFDEPVHKTPFQIRIARYPQQIAISNMPLQNTSLPDPEIDNRVWDTFQETPPIATYLVAFMVSEFESKMHENIFIWSRDDALNYTSYALSESGPLLRRMEMFTDVKYSLPKMDMVAVPDFAPGENWGLTMYRERCLLAQETQASEGNLELITRIVAHEFSHMWFGDYVTPTWWSYLWLNEGFATYFEYFATAQEKPTWRFDEYFVVNVVHTALSVDGIEIYHPLTYDFSEASEIHNIYDAVTYKKGASVIRMLEHIVSTPTFKSALNYYLTTHKEGSVKPSSLYDAFEKKVSEDDSVVLPKYTSLSEILRSWTETIGYPLVTVSRSELGNRTTFRQEVYVSPKSVKTTNTKSKWYIPITYTTKSKSMFTSTKPTLWIMTFQERAVLEEEVDDSEWILCNIQQSGYYRVNYDIANWKLLTDQLNEDHLRINTVNRAQLIDDSFTLAFDKKIPVDIPLRLSMYLVKERDPIPWLTALKHFEYFYSYFEASEVHLNVTEYITNIVEPWYTSVGLNVSKGDDRLTKIVRLRTASLACKIGINRCIVETVKYYEKNYDDLSKIQPDMKDVVFCSALRNQELVQAPPVWDDLWLLYKNTNVEYEKDMILTAFGCAHKDMDLKRLLYKLVNHNYEDIRKQQTMIILESVSATPFGVLATIHFLDDLLKKDGNLTLDDVDTMHQMTKIIHPLINTEDQLRDLQVLITNINRMDFKKYGKIHKLLISAYDKGVAEVNERKVASKQISPILRSIYVMKYQEISTTEDKSPREHNTVPPTRPSPEDTITYPQFRATTEKSTSIGNCVAASSILTAILTVFSVMYKN